MTYKRKPDGTFAKGNPGGPGRPPRATESEYMRILMDACPPDVFREIVERAIADAKAGDATARTWLASYLVGKPSAAAGAPKPARVLAEEVKGIDPVEVEAEALFNARLMNSIFPLDTEST